MGTDPGLGIRALPDDHPGRVGFRRPLSGLAVLGPCNQARGFDGGSHLKIWAPSQQVAATKHAGFRNVPQQKLMSPSPPRDGIIWHKASAPMGFCLDSLVEAAQWYI